jgi:hypothetical protein
LICHFWRQHSPACLNSVPLHQGCYTFILTDCSEWRWNQLLKQMKENHTC